MNGDLKYKEWKGKHDGSVKGREGKRGTHNFFFFVLIGGDMQANKRETHVKNEGDVK